MTSLVLHPSELLDPHGFEDGLLCASVLAALAPPESHGIVSTRAGDGAYGSPRHLLRHLVRTRLLPLFPWSSEVLMHQDPVGPPLRLWLFDDDGCPLRSRAQEVCATPPVVLDADVLRAAIAAVYPLRTAAQVGLYDAIGLPQCDHETVLALVAPFCVLEDDVLVLTAELYAGSCGTPIPGAVPGSGDVLDIAGRLFGSVASARMLVR